jgi:hypothetical protein
MKLIEFHQLPPSAYAIAIGNNSEHMPHQAPSGAFKFLARFPTFVPRSQSSSEAANEMKLLTCWEIRESDSAMSKGVAPILVLTISGVTTGTLRPHLLIRANLCFPVSDRVSPARFYFTR